MKSFLPVKQKSCPSEMMELNGNNTKKKSFHLVKQKSCPPEMMELNSNNTKKEKEKLNGHWLQLCFTLFERT